MAIWVLVKPRLRSHDTVDLFVEKLADLPGLRSFVMKPGYLSAHGAMNHDEFFTHLMTAEDQENFIGDFMTILLSQCENSTFTPLVTNRLLTPILPRDIDPEGESIRRRVRSRLDAIYANMGERFKGQRLHCVIFTPSPVDLAASVKLGLMLEDGYTGARAENVVQRLTESLDFGEYKIRSSGLFSRVCKVSIPAGASFAFLYSALISCGADLPKQIPSSWLLPRDVSDFYLVEALLPLSVRELLYAARPTHCSRVARPLDLIVESLIYTRRSTYDARSAVLPSTASGFADFATLSNNDALNIDEHHRRSYFWRPLEGQTDARDTLHPADSRSNR